MNIKELGKNRSPNGEYHRTLKHLRAVAKAYRENQNVKSDMKCLLSAELEKHGAYNINNGSGSFVIVL